MADIDSCTAGLAGGALGGAAANALGVGGLAAQIGAGIAAAGPLGWISFGLFGLGVIAASTLAGALGGGVAGGCFKPPVAPPPDHPGVGRAVGLLSFLPGIIGAVIVVIAVLSGQNSALLPGFCIAEAGSLLQLVFFFPIACGFWAKPR